MAELALRCRLEPSGRRGWALRLGCSPTRLARAQSATRPSFAACIYIATASPGDEMTSLRSSPVASAATDSASGRRSRATRSLRRAAGPRQAVASPESCATPSGHAPAPTGDCGIPEQVLRAVAEQPLIRPHPDLVSSEPMGIDLDLAEQIGCSYPVVARTVNDLLERSHTPLSATAPCDTNC